MTASEPSANLDARVADRLGTQETRRRRARIVAPLAVAATIVVALVLARGRHTSVVTPPTVLQSRTSPASALLVAPLPPSALVAQTTAAMHERTGARAARRSASPSEVAALAPDVLSVTSIRLSAIDPAESIRLSRLEAIEPIAVQPIGEPQGDRP